MVAMVTAAMARFPRLLARHRQSTSMDLPCARTSTFRSKPGRLSSFSAAQKSHMNSSIVCAAPRRKLPSTTAGEFSAQPLTAGPGDGGAKFRRFLQAVLWFTEGVYIFWLFLLPFAPGDPVWAISSGTINDLVGLSLNFFFILPLMNSVGIYLMNAPILHPMSEGLFNFVIGWTLMFAPLLFTDSKRDRYKGSLDILWGFQMFLTNTFLIPYMAIRLNDRPDSTDTPRKASQLGRVMTNGAGVVGLVGGSVCLMSIFWSALGRPDGNFGGVAERWNFLVSYVGSERLAYAFLWDICLYTIFQPWLVGDNLGNVKTDKVELVKYLRFVPVVGLFVYLCCLDIPDEDEY